MKKMSRRYFMKQGGACIALSTVGKAAAYVSSDPSGYETIKAIITKHLPIGDEQYLGLYSFYESLMSSTGRWPNFSIEFMSQQDEDLSIYVLEEFMVRTNFYEYAAQKVNQLQLV